MSQLSKPTSELVSSFDLLDRKVLTPRRVNSSVSGRVRLVPQTRLRSSEVDELVAAYVGGQSVAAHQHGLGRSRFPRTCCNCCAQEALTRRPIAHQAPPTDTAGVGAA